MSEVNVIKGNKLIAEFMGGKPKNHPLGCGNMGYKFPVLIGKGSTLGADWYSYDALKFDTSWDWLMPVVEKIESIGATWVQINGRHCDIWNYFDVREVLRNGDSVEETRKFKVRGNGKTKIEATYSAVLQFITWYNNNSTQSQ